jgi:very-short-patch-repair endonuclease
MSKKNPYLRGPHKISIEEWNHRYAQLGLDVEVQSLLPNGKYQCSCSHGHIFERVYLGNKTGCPQCADVNGFSDPHRRLAQWLTSKGLRVEVNTTKLIAPKEVDIYLPDLKIAIEVDGVYWHSDKFQRAGPQERLVRRKLLEDQGIRLLRFWDFECKNSLPTASYLKSTLGLNENKIGARKCEVKTIPTARAAEFLQQWHIQGATSASVNLGLYLGKKLLSVMTFRRPSISKQFDWELARFATRGGWNVSGGASRLFSAFTKDHQGSIVTYADRRYSEGGLYRSMGFELVRVSHPGYFYHSSKHGLVSRYRAQKHKLKQLLGDRFDESKSERENMEASHFYRIYDCGQFVFVYGANTAAVGTVKVPHVEIPERKVRTRQTVEEFEAKLGSNLLLIKPKTGTLLKKSPIKMRCSCGREWNTTPGRVEKSHANGCHSCCNRSDLSEVPKLLEKYNPGYEYVEGYEHRLSRCTFKLRETGDSFETLANNLIYGKVTVPRELRKILNEKYTPMRRKQILHNLGDKRI